MERRPHKLKKYTDRNRESSRRQDSYASRPESFDGAGFSRRSGSARASRWPDGASQKIRKIYLEEDGHEIPLDHTTRRSKKENTADLTWPDRAGDISAVYDTRRRSIQNDYEDSTAPAAEILKRTASTGRITYDSDNWSSYSEFDEDLDEGISYHEERMARKAAQRSRAASVNTSSQRSRSASSQSSARRRRSAPAKTSSARRRSASKKAPVKRGSIVSALAAALSRRISSAKAAPQRSRRTPDRTPSQRTRGGRKINKKKLLPFIAAAALVVVAIVIVIIIVSSGVKEAANLKLTSTDTTQTLSWDRKGKDIGYEVLQKASDGTFQIVKTVGAQEAASVTIEGLSSAVLYEYKICALKGSDHPKRSSGVNIKGYTAPSVLTDITAGTQSKETLTFVWSDAQPVAGFELRYGPSEDLSGATTVILTADNIVIDEGNGKNTYTLKNQPEGTKYYYSMRSFCDQNSYSDWTPTAAARVTRPVDMHGIDVNAPMVALTFDDGPDVSNITSRILDALASVGGHATFFQLGQRAEMYPEKIQRIVNEGHEIGNHTYDHAHLGDAVTSEDIIRANDAIEKAGGVRPVSFRSPGGNTTELIRQTCIQENMSLYYWSMDTRDWYTKNADETVSFIKSHVEDGDIILMHNIYDSSAAAVEEIVPWLVEQGYQLVTVSQLLVAKTGSLPEPGLEYSTATSTLDR